MIREKHKTLALFGALMLGAIFAKQTNGAVIDEFKVKREAVFTFAQEPTVTRVGDKVAITFETEGFCDVTVAIEREDGTIVRHLVSGVLGGNAPEPFKKNSKKQTIVWDGKDDTGVYVDDKDAVAVRVSLGLKPRFERTLFWHPWKKAGHIMILEPVADGVLVFKSGKAVDHLRYFDRDGTYVRTLYPFPADKIDDVPGIIRHRFPDGPHLPIKPNWQQSTLLMSGSNCSKPTYRDGKYSGYAPRKVELPGTAGYGLVAGRKRVALIGHRLSRLALDGSSDGLNLHGPDVSFHGPDVEFDKNVHPRRGAFSPDEEWLYLTMYNHTLLNSSMMRGLGRSTWRHAVKRIRFADNKARPENFAGGDKPGKEDGQFNMPADVATDAKGRVYVADHHNDRIQVFDADAKHLKNIPSKRPARITMNPKTGELFVFSWALPMPDGRRSGPSMSEHSYTLTRYAALDKGAKEMASWDLNIKPNPRGNPLLNRPFNNKINMSAAIDFSSDKLRIWVSAHSPVGYRGRHGRGDHGEGVMLLEQDGDGWTVIGDFLTDVKRSMQRVNAAAWNRQRLYVNPKDGMLYLVEGDSAHGKASKRMLQIDPDTGRTREIQFPLSAEDIAFDLNGHIYLRTHNMVMRYQLDTWREVPFDYGEERARHHFGNSGGERSGRVISGSMFRGGGSFHHGGFHVAPNGNLVVAGRFHPPSSAIGTRRHEAQAHESSTYQPTMYPGRIMSGAIHLIQILDRHGQMVYEDAVPGVHGLINGVAIDNSNDVYLLSAAVRYYNGARHFNDHAGTLMKFTPGKGRLISKSGAPVPAQPPNGPPDIALPRMWAEGAHWMYGGVGWGGQNYSSGCSCPNTRFALDYFARSFTPEIDRYNVGVLDSEGNLIVRVGQYGNVGDGVPLVKDGGPPNPHSIGGDETAIFFAPYVATHTDRRLFIADPGNARIASVKLGYHTDNLTALKNVPDQKSKKH